MSDILEKMKKIIDIEMLNREGFIDYYSRDLIEYNDFIYIGKSFLMVSIKDKENYLIFNEIENQKKLLKGKDLEDLYFFEKELIKHLKKEDRAERLYLTYFI